MTDQPPHLYTAAEWQAMTEHDRELLRADRRRAVEEARAEHEDRDRLLESLTVERFTRNRGPQEGNNPCTK